MTEQHIARIRKRRRVWRVTVGTSALGVIIVAILAWVLMDANHRFLAYAPYSNALVYYFDEVGAFPSSLSELEERYNAYERRVTDLPVEEYPRILFFPGNGADDAYHLAMAEPDTGSPLQLTRTVIYGNATDRKMRIEHLWRWQASKRIGYPEDRSTDVEE